MDDSQPQPLPGETFVETELVASSENIGFRIDKALSTHPMVGSRSQASRLLSRGLVTFEGKRVKSSHVVKPGDRFLILFPQIPKERLVPYEFPLDIAFEDSDVIVVNKPAGLVVHPAYGHAQDTLINAVLSHTTDLSQGFDELRPGLVHRLDKDTSGLIVLAKNEMAQRELALQFQRRTSFRIYRAIVFGHLKTPSGTIQSYLKRDPNDRRRVVSQVQGKFAVTHYRTLQKSASGLSLIECKLETGRTHQIRVHLSQLGHPIIGDSTYGGDGKIKSLKSVELRKMISGLNRFALHAFELGFEHPVEKLKYLFRVGWPDDLKPFTEKLELPEFPREVLKAVPAFSKDPWWPTKMTLDPEMIDTDE